LTTESIEAVLADFRGWLQELPAPAGAAALADDTVPAEERIDLHTLLGQFTALRHEVNLQTKAVRAQQEQNAETLRQLTKALGALEDGRALPERGVHVPTSVGDDQVRPLLKTLVDLADALGLARREMQRVQETVLPLLAQLDADGTDLSVGEVPELPSRPNPAATGSSLWERWFGRPAASADALEKTLTEQHQVLTAQRHRLQKLQEKQQQAGQAAARTKEFLDSVITGYTMSLQRVERALRQYELEPIPSVGEPFDPERMEVLEAVGGSGRPAGEVLDEIRRGYLWHGRVFRYAQVRVARS
jgi:molecular chaperone GrpE